MRMIGVVAVAVSLAVACAPEPEYVSTGSGSGGVPGSSKTVSAPLTGTSVEPLSNGLLAVADPDGDSIFLVKPVGRDQMKFPKGSRPVRVVEADDKLAVLLRGSGQLAVVKRTQNEVTPDDEGLSAACPE